MIRNLFLIVSVFIYAVAGSESDAIVEISNGKLQGAFNGHYYAFKGIPYAEPPVNENRFESPKLYTQKWTEIRDATKSGETCMRLDPLIKVNEVVFIGSEDCLFINVYTPKIKPEKPMPVIFFIHGGGYNFGSGDFHEEKLLMKHGDMIFVTFNYRLGPLGFMSTEDTEIAGNMGLKDQRLALKWVHDNIKAFGGDPNHVLMAGFSAGASSVEIQLLQQGVENYVSAAYSMSGSALCPWATKTDLLTQTKKVAELLKCPNLECTMEMKKCLKEAKAEDIVNATKAFIKFRQHPLVPWAPTVESSEVKDAMLLEMPEELIKKGKVAKIPYLSSYVEYDGAFVNAPLLHKNADKTTDLEYFNNNYKDLLPHMLFYDTKFTDKAEMDKYTDKLYNDVGITDGVVTEENFDKLSKIATEEVMSKCIQESWKLHKEHSSSKLYCYKYDYPAPFGISNLMSQRDDVKFGCTHGDDVLLMFDVPMRDFNKFNDVEKRHSENFLGLLDEFAKTGVPKFGDKTFPKNDKDTAKGVQYLFITENDVVTEKL